MMKHQAAVVTLRNERLPFHLAQLHQTVVRREATTHTIPGEARLGCPARADGPGCWNFQDWLMIGRREVDVEWRTKVVVMPPGDSAGHW